MSDLKKCVEILIEKASKADKADDAMKFSQAALNASNALYAIGQSVPVKK